MEHAYKVGILGAGPSGCASAYFLKNFCDVTLFDFRLPLTTLLPTGGGRCNFAHAEFDFKELAKNYPRGEKFLYSIFSKFSTSDTLSMFEQIGIDYYIQDDMRIFPKSNSSEDVRGKFLVKLNNVSIKKERGLRIEPQENSRIKLITDMGAYTFDALIISIGGHSDISIVTRLGVNVEPQIPALTGFKTKQDFSSLAGITLQNVALEDLVGDILFTHKGISGPLIYKYSSLNINKKYPYEIFVDLYPKEIPLQDLLNTNPHKQIDNLLSDFLPRRLVDYLLSNPTAKCHTINGKDRDKILNTIHNFPINILSTVKDGEVVMSGGVSLKDINTKTLESKKIKNLYFTGEVLDIDGFCGGFNLQNCWSTAYVVSEAIKQTSN